MLKIKSQEKGENPMNQIALAKQKKGIAIALKQFPWLREYDGVSGTYLWDRYDENDRYCWYIGKAINILRRTAQHIVDGQSHLDKSIKKHGLRQTDDPVWRPEKWDIKILEKCDIEHLDVSESFWISEWQKKYPTGKMYNVESGGTTGKTIIGERKQRRDVKWKAEARAKVLAEYREYFDIVPNENAIKGKGELKAEPKKLKGEYYGTETN